MQQISLAKVKSNFLSVIKNVEDGEEIVVLCGKRKQPVATIVPFAKWEKQNKTVLGRLEHLGPAWFSPDYDEVDEEFYADDPNDPLYMYGVEKK